MNFLKLLFQNVCQCIEIPLIFVYGTCDLILNVFINSMNGNKCVCMCACEFVCVHGFLRSFYIEDYVTYD